MNSIFDAVKGHIRDTTEDGVIRNPLLLFEPWDVAERPGWFADECRRDGINMAEPMLVSVIGKTPHPFQSGGMLSTDVLSATIAATQVGKTYPEAVDTIIMMTGEIPYCFRHPAGEKTGVKRDVTQKNIIRFGRRDSRTGVLIDHDINATEDPQSWDCGEIMGVGIYPRSKICTDMSQRAWIGTYKEARDQQWIPTLRYLCPPYLLDRTRGKDGIDERSGDVFFGNGTQINPITYEQDYDRFESRKVWKIVLDEEPRDRRIFPACLTHFLCALRLSYTPYHGISWSYHDIFLKVATRQLDIQIYHATMYDCPYNTRETVNLLKVAMSKWEIGARVYGLFTENTGEPYFDRDKLQVWINNETPMAAARSPKVFMPSQQFDDMIQRAGQTLPGLVDVDVSMVNAPDEKQGWDVFEDVRPNTGYLMAVDTADGDEDPTKASDFNVAIVMRAGEKWPVIVAACASDMPTTPFANFTMPAARYYNNAVLAVESKRGFSAGTYTAATQNWPWWFTMPVMNNRTRTLQAQRGFIPTEKTRPMIYEFVKDYLREMADLPSGVKSDNDPQIHWIVLLRQLCAAVVGKNGRCDHPANGRLDAGTGFGIGLYVFRMSADQVTCNVTRPAGGRPMTPILQRCFAGAKTVERARFAVPPLRTWRGG